MDPNRECYCSNVLSPYSAELDGTACDLPCAGDGGQTCGGHLKLSLYRKKKEENAAVRLNPLGFKDGVQGGVGSLLALGVGVVALIYLVW
jgi:hypothetical protein